MLKYCENNGIYIVIYKNLHYFQALVYAYDGMIKIVKDLGDNQSNVQISSLGVDSDNSNRNILDNSSKTEINNNILG